MVGQRQFGWNKLVATALLTALFLASSILFIAPKALAEGGTFTWKTPGPPPVVHVEDVKILNITGRSFDMTCEQQGSAGNGYLCTGNYPDFCPTKLQIGTDSSKGSFSTYKPGPGNNTGCTAATPQVQAERYDVAIGGAAQAPTDIPNTEAAGAGTGSDKTDPNLVCGESELRWVLCPIVKMINGMVGGLDAIIYNLLTVDQARIFSTDQDSGRAYHKSWVVFRGIALGILVVAALAMIVGQGLGFETLDPYTIKKILPRLIIAIIGIALSWEIMQFFVILTNSLGQGIRNLIYFPFKDFQGPLALGTGASIIAYLLSGAAITGFGVLGLLSFGLTALLALLIAFFVLVLRQLIIIVLVLAAPIAIACFVLPNTQTVWKLWHESFSKALLMFPIIAAFIALGRVFAIVSINGGTTGTGPNISAVNQLIGFAAYVMPYFLIPYTFRFAGGAMRAIGGSINDRNRGGFDRLKKYRQGQYQRHGARSIDKHITTPMLAKRAAYVNALQNEASREVRGGNLVNGVRRWGYRRVANGVGGYNIEADMSAKRAARQKEVNDQIATGMDDEVRGLTVDKSTATTANGRMRISNGNRQFKSLGGAWINEAQVDAGQKRWGKDPFAQQAALSYEMRKAGTEEEISGLAKNYHNVARNAWGNNDYEAGGAWIGAAFENQNQHLQFKQTNWKTGGFTDDSGKFDQGRASKFASEVYEKKGSYPLAQMSSETIGSLRNAYDNGDAVTKQRVSAIAETFMTRYGSSGAIGGDDPAQVAAAYARGAGPGGPGGQPTFQTNSPGAAHVNERVRELAIHTGVYAPDLPTPRTTSAKPGVNPITITPTGPARPNPVNKRQN